MTQNAANWSMRVEPRKWQLAALNRWVGANGRGVVEVVTGGGKTVFAEMCMLNYRDAVRDGQTIIVVPTLALIDQWFVSLLEDLGVDEHDLAVYSGESKPRKPGLVNLMTLNTARKIAPELSEKRPTFLIVDECHRIGSPANALGLQGEHIATLGLSATPEREHDQAFEELIAPALGKVMFRYDYNQARQDGVIAPFELVNVALNLSDEERKQYDKLTRQVAKLVKARSQGEDVEFQLLHALRRRAKVSSSARMRIPVSLQVIARHESERILVFHEQIPAAEAIYQRLQRAKRSATIYHSKIGPAIRRDNLRLFRKGTFEILVSCRALDEGVNVPETTVAVISSSTASARQRIQRLGRVLRPAPGKEKAIVYTLYATQVEEQRLAKESESLTSADAVRWMRSSVAQHGSNSS